jgi:hypothetical protein
MNKETLIDGDNWETVFRKGHVFRVVAMHARAGGWFVVAYVNGARFRRYWTESEAPNKRTLMADFRSRPDAWIQD